MEKGFKKSHSINPMDRFMLHLKNHVFQPKTAVSLRRKARELCGDLDCIIRDCRVSSKHIEFDVSINKDSLELLVARLSSIGPLDDARLIVEEHFDKEEAIEKGIFYFNNERFWECHEVFEGVWKKCFEGEKDLVQGIILVAAALVHFQKDETDVCFSIIDRALQKLSSASGMYHKIDVDTFCEKVQKIKKTGKIATFAI